MSVSDCRAQFTVSEKRGGPPTKRIVPRDGKLITISSDCRIAAAFDPRAFECRGAA